MPQQAREALGLREGDLLVLKRVGDGLRLEKAEAPLVRFERLAEKTRRRFAERGITPADVEEAIRWARSGKRRESS